MLWNGGNYEIFGNWRRRYRRQYRCVYDRGRKGCNPDCAGRTSEKDAGRGS